MQLRTRNWKKCLSALTLNNPVDTLWTFKPCIWEPNARSLPQRLCRCTSTDAIPGTLTLHTALCSHLRMSTAWQPLHKVNPQRLSLLSMSANGNVRTYPTARACHICKQSSESPVSSCSKSPCCHCGSRSHRAHPVYLARQAGRCQPSPGLRHCPAQPSPGDRSHLLPLSLATPARFNSITFALMSKVKGVFGYRTSACADHFTPLSKPVRYTIPRSVQPWSTYLSFVSSCPCCSNGCIYHRCRCLAAGSLHEQP